VLIQGAPSAEWWSRQSLDTSFKFSNAVRQGLAQSETNQQIIARIIGKRGCPWHHGHCAQQCFVLGALIGADGSERGQA
jgi:hypothetical protein